MALSKAIVKSFGNTQVEFLQDEKGELWLTGETIGNALGYTDPGKAIRKLFERHRELLEQFSVNLTRNSKGRPAKAFNEIGCNIIAMKSNTKLSDQFVIWAAHIIKDYREKKIKQGQDLQVRSGG